MVDEVARVKRNNIGIGKGFYTVSEAAKLLEVGQRRILQMLETKEIEGERDPTSSRWKISKHAIHELALEETPSTKEPPLTEEETAKPRSAEETQEATEELLPASQQPPREEDSTETSSEHSAQEMRERVAELEHLNDRLQHEHQAEKAAWQEEKESLLAAANQGHQYREALQKEVAKLGSELEESRQLTGKLERLNDRLQHEQQTKKVAWREEKESLLTALDRARQHIQRLQEEVEMLSTELETERRRRSWRGLLRK